MRCLRLTFALIVLLAAVLCQFPSGAAAQATPVAGGGLAGGPGLALLPDEADASGVLASGIVGDHVLVIARNNLTEPAEILVMAAGLDAAGELVWVAKSGSTGWTNGQISEGVQPGFVPAGGIALVVLALPEETAAATTVKYRAVAEPEDPFFADPEKDLEIASAKLDGDQIKVEVRNLAEEPRDSAYLVAFCLEEDGTISGFASNEAPVAMLEGEAAIVELPLGGQPCANFVVTARDSF